VANVEQRTRTAEQALAAARAEQAQAQGTLTGKDQAVDALATFYGDVLAPDLPGARRLTYARLAQLAERSNVTYQRGTYDPVEERGSTLTRLKVSMDLTGSYADIRAFIHDVETAPEFVVIDNVLLADVGGGGALRLSLELSTYFRNTAS
jgi:Tfp pilus assembly protein PilO